MSNHAAQENLVSLNSIGLLAYITSLPEDWILHKTFLQNKFTRRTVDSAWNELLEKKYVAGFSMYVDRKKQYYYLASDEELTQREFNEFVEETFFEVHEQTGFVPKNLQVIKDNQFTIEFDFKAEIEKLSGAHLVQHKEYSTLSTVPDEHIQISSNKEIKQKNNNKKIVVNNKDEFFAITDQLFLDQDQYSKSEWDIIMDKFFIETIGKEIYNLEAYIRSAISNIIHRRKLRTQQPIVGQSRAVPFYNWLTERS